MIAGRARRQRALRRLAGGAARPADRRAARRARRTRPARSSRKSASSPDGAEGVGDRRGVVDARGGPQLAADLGDERVAGDRRVLVEVGEPAQRGGVGGAGEADGDARGPRLDIEDLGPQEGERWLRRIDMIGMIQPANEFA